MRTSMPLKRLTAALTAASASWGLVTSSLTTSRLSESPSASATASGLRPVATTLWPAPSAALAMSAPMPRPAPVISQVSFCVVIAFDFLALRVWLRVRGVHRARREAVVVVGARGVPHGKGDQREEPARDHDDAEGGWAVFAQRRVESEPADGGAGNDAAV